MEINYEIYRKKVESCFMGKAIGGTLGMPYEGNLDIHPLTYYDPVPDKMQPNDDLDLQIINLEIIQRHGLPISRYWLSDVWKEHMEEGSPDEYGAASSNQRMKLYAPLSGQYRNKFQDGMGGAIRSELWACLAPGNPELASTFAREDACTDHTENGIYAAMFLAAMESMAFIESDINKLVAEGLSHIPVDCRLACAIRDTMKWYDSVEDVLAVRKQILEKYGVDNWTDVSINLSFIILALISCEGDFGKAVCNAVMLGYDADCTGATVGAVMGMIHPEGITHEWKSPLGNQLVLNPDVINMHEPDTIDEVCEIITSLVMDVADYYKTGLLLTEVPGELPHFKIASPHMTSYEALYDWEVGDRNSLLMVNPFMVSLVYPRGVAAVVGQETQYCFQLVNTSAMDVEGTIELSVPMNWELPTQSHSYSLKKGESCELPFVISIPHAKRRFWNNILKINLQVNGLVFETKAGIPISRPWKVTDLTTGEVTVKEEVSQYFTVPQGAYKYQGDFIATAKKQVRLSCSGNRPFEVWLNGEKVFARKDCFYVPTLHRDETFTTVNVERGENHLEILFEAYEEGEFSLVFGTLYGCSMWIDSMEFVEIQQ